MESPLIGSKIFTRYHQQQAQLYREQNQYRSDVGDIDGIDLSPTRRRAAFVPKKTTASKARQTGIDCILLDPNSDRHNDHIVDDLTMGYSARFTTERNPAEYALSPGSARYFRIISLDGCHEEQVSPMFPSSLLSSISSFQLPNVPLIPGPVLSSLDAEEEFPPLAIRKRANDAIIPNATKTPKLSTKVDGERNSPTSKQRRRSSNHNRSQFVFDGNLCFGSINPSPIYVSPTPMYLSPTGRVSLPDISMVNYPLSAAAPMSPPRAFDIGSYDEEEDSRGRQKQGRNTPPPSHQEQRRRNRAMPSIQYETDILNDLRRQHHHDQQQLRQQNSR